ncbi:Alpha/Beta hydrolase protein [Penicillium odoratum]|uniref:Alpha/Beta hydrolase protein n=1 Tax=Penicillium odoratum TaxID=1167516 RepID=UPI002547961F|nr:Alpha/Beta hydrolase protein [Penicillium odoratum]KAJ5777521.1 Alpha/Beta hydrolase protein [Penicillium odoratum]
MLTFSMRFSLRIKRDKRDQKEEKALSSSTPTASSIHLHIDGVEELYRSPDPVAFDICFIHGLTGDRRTNWTSDGQSAPWPESLLPLDLSGARILTYGYDAYIIRSSVASFNRLIGHATNLLNDLTTDRTLCGATGRPLVFIAHSLGGLVCKKAILLSRNNVEPHLRDIFDSVKGIIFMGTPHKGSWIANWAKIPVNTLGIMKSVNKSLLEVLSTENQLLESIQLEFWAMIRELQRAGRAIEVTLFFEELPLTGPGLVVSKESATLEGYNSMSIHANHRDMVKFGSADDNGYKRLLGELRRWNPHNQYVGELHLTP